MPKKPTLDITMRLSWRNSCRNGVDGELDVELLNKAKSEPRFCEDCVEHRCHRLRWWNNRNDPARRKVRPEARDGDDWDVS